MQGLRAKEMESLRARIAALEKRPVLAAGAAPLRRDRADEFPVAAPGLLHEIFSDEHRNGGAALGFALAQARTLLNPARPALLVMQLNRETQDMGLPYGAGLAVFGLDPDAVVLVRAESVVELLWAVEEGASCRAVAAVVADVAGHHKALDFTASRRLSLRTAAAGTSVFLVRYGGGREASAARLRWRVMPAASQAPPFDARAPGAPRWSVTLEKGRLSQATRNGAEGANFLMDWTKNGFALVDERGKADGGGSTAPGFPPLPGAEPAALGDRLSQAG